jgi:hypothetical protein
MKKIMSLASKMFYGVSVAVVSAAVLWAGYGTIQNAKPYTITGDGGGAIFEYIVKYGELRQVNKPIRVSDICLSACTMVLGLAKPGQACAEPSGLFGFHSAYFMTAFGPRGSQEGTRLLWNIYPKVVQERMKARGWDGEGEAWEHPELIYVRATDLLPVCN